MMQLHGAGSSCPGSGTGGTYVHRHAVGAGLIQAVVHTLTTGSFSSSSSFSGSTEGTASFTALRPLCQLATSPASSAGSASNSGYGGAADYSYRAFQTSCWPAEGGITATASGESISSLPFYVNPSSSGDGTGGDDEYDDDDGDVVGISYGRGTSTAAVRGGVSYGTLPTPHWLTPLLVDSAPMMLAAISAAVSEEADLDYHAHAQSSSSNGEETGEREGGGNSSASASASGLPTRAKHASFAITVSVLQTELSILGLLHQSAASTGAGAGAYRHAEPEYYPSLATKSLRAALTLAGSSSSSSSTANVSPSHKKAIALGLHHRRSRVLLLLKTLRGFARVHLSEGSSASDNDGTDGGDGNMLSKQWARTVRYLCTQLVAVSGGSADDNTDVAAFAAQLSTEVAALLLTLLPFTTTTTGGGEQLRRALWEATLRMLQSLGIDPADASVVASQTQQPQRQEQSSSLSRVVAGLSTVLATLAAKPDMNARGYDGAERALVVKLLVSMVPVAHANGARDVLIATITTLLGAPRDTKAGEEEEERSELVCGACDLLAENMLTAATSPSASPESSAQALMLLDAWVSVAALAVPPSSNDGINNGFPRPAQFAAVVLRLSQEQRWVDLLPILHQLTRAVKQSVSGGAATAGVAHALLEVTIPAIVVTITSTSTTIGGGEALLDCQLAMVQLLLLLFSTVSELSASAENVMALVLPVLCTFLRKTQHAKGMFQQTETARSPAGSTAATQGAAWRARLDQSISFVGKALVQLAKMHADAFRVQVAALTEQARGLLQLCMRDAIMTERAMGAGSGGGNNGGGGMGAPAAPMSLKIDASKFGKK
jgi:hypothetical protein